jgi:radical SAM superfamily enzyme YgiQ (UPF0313 family)
MAEEHSYSPAGAGERARTMSTDPIRLALLVDAEFPHARKGAHMKKILLITPDFNPEEAKIRSLSTKFTPTQIFPQKVFMAPLSLATLAALTPADIDVDIWDEAVHGLISDDTDLQKDYDLVGVTGYINHLWRVKQLGEIFRRRGIPVAVGGPGVSSAPEYYRNSFDTLFIGEAEYSWPQFLTDWKAGRPRPEYRQVEKVDMTLSPQPRWDKVAADMDHYLIGPVQTTRGCPFDCEFCDVIYIYGRQARHKSIEQVLEEVAALERLGAERIVFCDDNFIGNPRYAKALLRALIPLNNAFRRPLGFYTQITLNVAKDDEMLELLADANFAGLLIGLESPNIESLIETNKPQNYKTDMLADIHKIQSYGLPILASLIVGFDHDDSTIFDRHFEFIQEACLPIPSLHILKAPVGTKLWVRLHREGRVVRFWEDIEKSVSDIRLSTNIIPKQVTRTELMSGYLSLVEHVRDWRNFEARVKGMIALIRRQPKVKPPSLPWKLRLRALKCVLFDMDKEARRSAIRLFLYTRRQVPFMMPKVMAQIARQYTEAAELPFLREEIEARIRLESSEEFKLEFEPTVFFVPEAFKKPYKDIFPALYERVSQGLIDKSRTQAALVEIIYDFLTRWGATFEQFEEHHRAFLFEICDRTIAKENSTMPAGAGEQLELGEVPDRLAGLSGGQTLVWLRRLADEVLRTVEQDLRSFQGPPPASESEAAVVS